MKKMIVLTIMMLFVSEIFGQQMNGNSKTQDMLTAASVKASVKITATSDISFGIITQGNDVTLDPKTSNGAGLFTIKGHKNSQVTPTFSTTGLSMTNSAFSLSWEANVVGTATIANRATASTLISGTAVTLPSNGDYYIYVGGTVSVSETQEPLDYTGTYTLSIAY